MPNSILFPFDINDDNREAYAKAIQLAEREKEPIFLFTAIPESNYENQINEVYFHLLELNGYFQTKYNNWKGKPSIPIKRIIRKGDLLDNLKQVIFEKMPKWIISHPTSILLNRNKIEETLGLNKNIIATFNNHTDN